MWRRRRDLSQTQWDQAVVFAVTFPETEWRDVARDLRVSEAELRRRIYARLSSEPLASLDPDDVDVQRPPDDDVRKTGWTKPVAPEKPTEARRARAVLEALVVRSLTEKDSQRLLPVLSILLHEALEQRNKLLLERIVSLVDKTRGIPHVPYDPQRLFGVISARRLSTAGQVYNRIDSMPMPIGSGVIGAVLWTDHGEETYPMHRLVERSVQELARLDLPPTPNQSPLFAQQFDTVGVQRERLRIDDGNLPHPLTTEERQQHLRIDGRTETYQQVRWFTTQEILGTTDNSPTDVGFIDTTGVGEFLDTFQQAAGKPVTQLQGSPRVEELAIAIALAEIVARDPAAERAVDEALSFLDSSSKSGRVAWGKGFSQEDILVIIESQLGSLQDKTGMTPLELAQALRIAATHIDWEHFVVYWFIQSALTSPGTGAIPLMKPANFEMTIAWQKLSRLGNYRIMQRAATAQAQSSTNRLLAKRLAGDQKLQDLQTYMPFMLRIADLSMVNAENDSPHTAAATSHTLLEAPPLPEILLGVNIQDAEIVRFAASISRMGKMTFDDCLHFVNTRSLFHRFYEGSATGDSARVVILNRRRPPNALYVSRIDQPLPLDARKAFEAASLGHQLQFMVQLAKVAEKIWAQSIATGQTLCVDVAIRNIFCLHDTR